MTNVRDADFRRKYQADIEKESAAAIEAAKNGDEQYFRREFTNPDKQRIFEMALLEKDADGNTPLHHAMRSQNPAAAVVLIDRIKPNGINELNNKGESPIYLAAEKYQFTDPVVRSLLTAGADVTKAPPEKKTPEEMLIAKALDIAVAEAKIGDTDFLNNMYHQKEVQDIHLKVLAAADAQGNTPLHWAVENGHFDYISDILNYKQSYDTAEFLDVMKKNDAGKTALELAAEKGNLRAIGAILGYLSDIGYGRYDSPKIQGLSAGQKTALSDMVRGAFDILMKQDRDELQKMDRGTHSDSKTRFDVRYINILDQLAEASPYRDEAGQLKQKAAAASVANVEANVEAATPISPGPSRENIQIDHRSMDDVLQSLRFGDDFEGDRNQIIALLEKMSNQEVLQFFKGQIENQLDGIQKIDYIIEKYLDRNPGFIKQRDEDGQTLLHYVANNVNNNANFGVLASNLIEQYKGNPFEKDRHNNSPLDLAYIKYGEGNEFQKQVEQCNLPQFNEWYERDRKALEALSKAVSEKQEKLQDERQELLRARENTRSDKLNAIIKKIDVIKDPAQKLKALSEEIKSESKLRKKYKHKESRQNLTEDERLEARQRLGKDEIQHLKDYRDALQKLVKPNLAGPAVTQPSSPVVDSTAAKMEEPGARLINENENVKKIIRGLGAEEKRKMYEEFKQALHKEFHADTSMAGFMRTINPLNLIRGERADKNWDYVKNNLPIIEEMAFQKDRDAQYLMSLVHYELNGTTPQYFHWRDLAVANKQPQALYDRINADIKNQDPAIRKEVQQLAKDLLGMKAQDDNDKKTQTDLVKLIDKNRPIIIGDEDLKKLYDGFKLQADLIKHFPKNAELLNEVGKLNPPVIDEVMKIAAKHFGDALEGNDKGAKSQAIKFMREHKEFRAANLETFKNTECQGLKEKIQGHIQAEKENKQGFIAKVITALAPDADNTKKLQRK